MCTSARPARCRSTMWRAMCSASSSTRNASPITTSSIASSNSSGKRDMCTPFCAGSRSTEQVISDAISVSRSPWRWRMAFCTLRTPTRERPIGTSGADAWRSWLRRSGKSAMIPANGTSLMPDDTFARLVSLACHDLRTPLATVYGFARTLTRTEVLDERSARFVGMIESASEQMTELLDQLGVAARIEAGRYDPALVEVDTLDLATSADERISAAGEGR